MSNFNNYGAYASAPCKGCKIRKLACSMKCPIYKEFRENLEMAKEKGARVVDIRFMDFPGIWQHFSGWDPVRDRSRRAGNGPLPERAG